MGLGTASPVIGHAANAADLAVFRGMIFMETNLQSIRRGTLQSACLTQWRCVFCRLMNAYKGRFAPCLAEPYSLEGLESFFFD